MDDSDFQKEGFAHLNKIQLVFLTIVFVGFAADVTLDKSSLDTARDQLAGIKDIAVKWNPNWLMEAAAKKVHSLPSVEPERFTMTVLSTRQLALIELPRGEFKIQPLPEKLNAAIISDYRNSGEQRVSIGTPTTLSGFWTLWDVLMEKIPIYTEFKPIDELPIAHIIRFGEWERSDRQFSTVLRVERGDTPVQPVYRLNGHLSEINPSWDLGDLKKWQPTHTMKVELVVDRDVVSVTSYMKARSTVALDGQQSLVAEHGFNWHFGSAKDVFKDLYAISANFADLPLDKISLILDSEASRYGERLFILGVNLPAGQLAVWSLLLTTIVYVYFLVMLLGVARYFEKNPQAVAYPWIALLPGRISLFASLVSLCLFPAVFGVVKCFAIWRLANLSMTVKMLLTATVVILISSAATVAKTVLMLRRTQA
jgi:hypothetical protein